ncbi:hypothetical protein VTJ49DRAFT_6124 [Mycothermus thermophilus]|uniref:Uncharacterized protein n=1 Tax=Humicola insolens TaxID=85995 RepID=A0ABR3VJH9_HUMIN
MYGQRHPQRPQQRSAYQPAASDRFRQPTMGAPSPSGTARAPAAMAQGTMGYHSAAPEYGQADSRQSQSFGGTYPQMMYNVQQTGGPQSGGVYDAGQPYSSRQAAGLPMMATDVTGPYFSGESGLHGYSAGSMQPAIGAMPAQTAAPDVRMEEGYAPATTALDESYAQYQSEVKGIFENIRNSNLTAASEALLRVSEWLLLHVVDLGLTTDNQSLHDERITLWNDFNHAWLALFQRQKEMMEAGLQTVQRPQTVVSQETLKKMGKELVRLCDNIERHGLVDYQYGVWEEQIVDILEECLDLYEAQQSSAAGGNEGASSSHRR